MQVRWSLPSEPGSVREARSRVRRLLADEGVSTDECDVAALLVSELVSNAVVHASSFDTIELGVRSGATGIHIDVLDHDPTPPRLSESEVPGEHGAGLRIVSRMSSRWGWGPINGDGKHVWCDVAPGGS